MKLTRKYLRKLIRESVGASDYLEKAKEHIKEWKRKTSYYGTSNKEKKDED